METAVQRIVEELTPKEKERLQRAIAGYGRLKHVADVAELHFQTIKNVARIGRGEKNTIDKLRKTVLAA